MQKPELEKWIQKARHEGKSDEIVLNELVTQGWKEKDIKKALQDQRNTLSVEQEAFIFGQHIFTRLWGTIKQLIVPIITISALHAVVFIGLQLLTSSFAQTYWLLLLFWVLMYIVSMYFIAALVYSVTFRENSLGTILSESAKLYLPFLGTSTLAVFAVLGGTVLFVIPGIFLAIIFAPLPFIIVKEHTHGISALKRCYALTRDFRWEIFFKILLLFVLIVAILAAIIMIFVAIWLASAFSTDPSTAFGAFLSNELGFILIQLVLLLLFLPFIYTYYAVLYADLEKVHTKGSDPESSLKQGKILGLVFMIFGVFASILLGVGIWRVLSTGAYNYLLDPTAITEQSVNLAQTQYELFLEEKESFINDESDRDDVTRSIDIIGIQVALQKYYLTNEKYPDSLNELVPTYLEKMLVDPSTLQPYEYSTGEDGQTWEICATYDSEGFQCVEWP